MLREKVREREKERAGRPHMRLIVKRERERGRPHKRQIVKKERKKRKNRKSEF